MSGTPDGNKHLLRERAPGKELCTMRIEYAEGFGKKREKFVVGSTSKGFW